MPVLRDENEYFSSIPRCEECQKRDLTTRPTESANRNFLTGYCMEPAPNKNGSMGTGGGSKAGIAKRQKTPELFNWLALISIQAEGRQRAEASELMSRHNSPGSTFRGRFAKPRNRRAKPGWISPNNRRECCYW